MSGIGGLPRLVALPERPHAVKPPPMVRIAPVTKPASVSSRKGRGLVDAPGRLLRLIDFNDPNGLNPPQVQFPSQPWTSMRSGHSATASVTQHAGSPL